MKTFIESVKNFLSQEQIFLNEPMSQHTTFKIGGCADVLLLPKNIGEVQKILKLVKTENLPLTILGNGSNVLVADDGIRGVVLVFGKPFSYIRAENEKIFVGAGTLLGKFARWACEEKAMDFAFATGIPGSVGGAIYMNAGAYDGEVKNFVQGVTTVTLDGEIKHYDLQACEFSYRKSIFHDCSELICEVEFSPNGSPEKKEIILEKIKEFREKRLRNQPIELPSAGSTFKRPQNFFAAALIDQAGLKGVKIGGAEVSKKHAGFIVNVGHATAQNVFDLIQLVKQRVFEIHGVHLDLEIRLLGEFKNHE